MQRKVLSFICAVCIVAAGCETLSGSSAERGDGGALYVADASASGSGGSRGKSGDSMPDQPPGADKTAGNSAAVTMETTKNKKVAAAPSSLTESLHDALGQVKEQRARISALNEKIGELTEKLAAESQKVKELKSDLAERDERVQKLQDAVDKWKQDILGYRDEMRQAEEAEMKALTRIIALLKKCSAEEDTNQEETGE